MSETQIPAIDEIKTRYLVDFWRENATIDEPYSDEGGATSAVAQLERNVRAWITSAVARLRPQTELWTHEMPGMKKINGDDMSRIYRAGVVSESWEKLSTQIDEVDLPPTEVLRHILHGFFRSDVGRAKTRGVPMNTSFEVASNQWVNNGNPLYVEQFEIGGRELAAIQEIVEIFIRDGLDGLRIPRRAMK